MDNNNSMPELPDEFHDETGNYPSEEILEYIKKFDCIKHGCRPLAELIGNVWWASEWGYSMKGNKLYLSTGGWSGNEDIIVALRENFMFWSMCWMQSKRGGHYVFVIPKLKKNK